MREARDGGGGLTKSLGMVTSHHPTVVAGEGGGVYRVGGVSDEMSWVDCPVQPGGLASSCTLAGNGNWTLHEKMQFFLDTVAEISKKGCQL